MSIRVERFPGGVQVECRGCGQGVALMEQGGLFEALNRFLAEHRPCRRAAATLLLA